MKTKELNDLADLLDHTIQKAGDRMKDKFLADMAAAAALKDRFAPLLKMAASLHRYNIPFGQYLPDTLLWIFKSGGYDAHYEFDDGGKYKLGIDRWDRNGKCLLAIHAGYVNHTRVEFKAAPDGDVWIDYDGQWMYGIRHDGTPLIRKPDKYMTDNPLVIDPWTVPEYRNAPVLFLKYFPVFEKHFVKYVKKVIKDMENEK